jgi:hypothetical protein
VSSFSTGWLALREPLDAASRAASLARSLGERVRATQLRYSRIEVIDLGAGTGANLRYAAPLLAGAQDWLLVERDPLLLAAMAERTQAWSRSIQGQFTASGAQFCVQADRFECQVQSLALDLATQLDSLPLRSGELLTASALLDLVSEQWLRRLMQRAAAVQAAVWFTLTYDGRIDCEPVEAEDAEVRALVNQHQLGDKGFGLALGPMAASTARAILGEHGYEVQWACSDWCVGPNHAALQYALIEGWFVAACELAPARTAMLRAWQERRRAHVEAGRSTLRVGHVDMVGRPVG